MSVPHFLPWFGQISQIWRRKSFINRPGGALVEEWFWSSIWMFFMKNVKSMSVIRCHWCLHHLLIKCTFLTKQCLSCKICIKCTKLEMELPHWTLLIIYGPWTFFSNLNWSGEGFIEILNCKHNSSPISVNIFRSFNPNLSSGNIRRLL